MGLSASQGRMLLLTARKSDLEYRAQQISQKRLILSQQLEQIALEYEAATSNRQMKIALYGQDKDSTVRTTNLTYAALISGAIGIGADKSGITANDDTYGLASQWQSTSAYRLVTADDAIVVSNVNEIPTEVEVFETKSSEFPTEKNKDNDHVYTQTIDGADNKNYAVFDYKDKHKDSALGKILNNTKEPLKDSKVSIGKNAAGDGIVKIEGDTEADTKYYNLSDGKEITQENAGTLNDIESNIKIVSDSKDIPMSTKQSKDSTKYEFYVIEGKDHTYSLAAKTKGGENLPFANYTYVVDANLQGGTSDINGESTGPNYLQDCLRNGKYLLQKGQVDDNIDTGYRWSNLSWDATANISDGYYTEDDDAAKAKYDRLQNQIQAQDKKLELELDQIETQRSAVTTEEESVQKVIDENIEGSFNAFA